MTKMTNKKNQKEEREVKEVKIVGVKELSEEFGIPPSNLRKILRANGLRAPETGAKGFGPKAKYGWPEGSEELETIYKFLESYDPQA